MTGSALMDFLVSIILLLATGAMFFLVIDRIAPDAVLNRIGKIAVGVKYVIFGVALIALLIIAEKTILGGSAAIVLRP